MRFFRQVMTWLVMMRWIGHKPRGVKVRKLTLPLSGGARPARLYKPDIDGPLPVLLFFHGGGFVAGNPASYDGFCRVLCARSGYLIVSLDYRLAPEHPFPAAIEDSIQCMDWAIKSIHAYQGDPKRICVAGDSAGGNLAAATALHARDAHPHGLQAQVLLYPVTDHASSDHLSYAERAEGYLFTTEGMKRMWQMYLPNDEVLQTPDAALAAPLRAASHEGLPPAFVLTAEYDPLRDEGKAYAERLSAHEVEVTTEHYAEEQHGFLGAPTNTTYQAIDHIASWLKSRF